MASLSLEEGSWRDAEQGVKRANLPSRRRHGTRWTRDVRVDNR